MTIIKLSKNAFILLFTGIIAFLISSWIECLDIIQQYEVCFSKPIFIGFIVIIFGLVLIRE